MIMEVHARTYWEWVSESERGAPHMRISYVWLEVTRDVFDRVVFGSTFKC